MALVGIAKELLGPVEQSFLPTGQVSGSAYQQALAQAYDTLLPWSCDGPHFFWGTPAPGHACSRTPACRCTCLFLICSLLPTSSFVSVCLPSLVTLFSPLGCGIYFLEDTSAPTSASPSLMPLHLQL